jgi:Raf kinase inhibitor-like YbhB/YbcL family protein
MTTKNLGWLCAALLIASLVACSSPAPADAPTLPAATAAPATATLEPTLAAPTNTPAPFVLSSPSFSDVVPDRFACTGADLSPEFVWDDPPAGTVSFAFLFDDPGAPWVHWVAYNIPAGLRGFPEDIPPGDTIPVGGLQGINSWGSQDFRGPCPPQGETHTYVYTLYALDTMLPTDAPLNRLTMQNAMEGHILAQTEMRATFSW